MLVLTLEPGQSIVLTDEHGPNGQRREIVIKGDRKETHRLAIEAPREFQITRRDSQGNLLTRTRPDSSPRSAFNAEALPSLVQRSALEQS